MAIEILGMIRRDVKRGPPEVSNQPVKCSSGVLNIGNARMNRSSKNRNYFPWNRAVPGTQQYFPHTGIPEFEPISMSMISKAKWFEEIKKFHPKGPYLLMACWSWVCCCRVRLSRKYTARRPAELQVVVAIELDLPGSVS